MRRTFPHLLKDRYLRVFDRKGGGGFIMVGGRVDFLNRCSGTLLKKNMMDLIGGYMVKGGKTKNLSIHYDCP